MARTQPRLSAVTAAGRHALRCVDDDRLLRWVTTVGRHASAFRCARRAWLGATVLAPLVSSAVLRTAPLSVALRHPWDLPERAVFVCSPEHLKKCFGALHQCHDVGNDGEWKIPGRRQQPAFEGCPRSPHSGTSARVSALCQPSEADVHDLAQAVKMDDRWREAMLALPVADCRAVDVQGSGEIGLRKTTVYSHRAYPCSQCAGVPVQRNLHEAVASVIDSV